MVDKALISELSWRSLGEQRRAFPDMPHYMAPDEIGVVLRQSTRNEQLKLHVLSLAIIADNEKAFRDFITLARKINAVLCLEDGLMLSCNAPIKHLVGKWREARREGAAKVGGRISADRKEASTKTAIELIREDWPKPSSEFSTQELKDRCDLSLNTIKKHLGSRPIAQYNYQAKLKRKANAKR